MPILNYLLLVRCFVLKLVLFNITNILICHLRHVNVLLSLGYLMEMTEFMFIVFIEDIDA